MAQDDNSWKTLHDNLMDGETLDLKNSAKEGMDQLLHLGADSKETPG